MTKPFKKSTELKGIIMWGHKDSCPSNERDCKVRVARFVSGVGLCLALGLSIDGPSRGDDGANSELRRKLIAAWTKRSEAHQTVRVRWTHLHYAAPEFAYFGRIQAGKLARSLGKEPPPLPKEGKTVEESVLLVIDGGKMRFEADLVQWMEQRGDFVGRHYISTWNGTDPKSLWSDDGVGHRAGFVLKDDGNSEGGTFLVQPLLWWCRPFDPLHGRYEADRLELPSPALSRDTVDRLPARSPAQGGGRHAIYVDPMRSFVITSFADYDAAGQLRMQGTMDYRDDAVFGYVPTSWEVMRVGADGEALESYKCRVDQLDLNKATDPKECDLEFPVGCWVKDARHNKEYLVRENGVEREVLRSEIVKGEGDRLSGVHGKKADIPTRDACVSGSASRR